MENDVQIDAELRDWIAKANKLVVFSGAGMSAESNVPTFRDAISGLWANFNPQELASAEGFIKDPSRSWEWYQWRRELVRKAEPNAGHLAVAQFQRENPGKLRVVTQNVDDLHERAGSSEVLHLHGELFADRWFGPCAQSELLQPRCDVSVAVAGSPPYCGECGNPLRPKVVWFGEEMPKDEWAQAQRAAKNCDLMLVVGTSGHVWPAAQLPHLAKARGARMVVLNPEESELDEMADRVVRGTAAKLLPKWLGKR